MFYALLSDLKPHAVAEFERRLWDECGLNLRVTVQMHISLLRNKLPAGEHIVTKGRGADLKYQLVRSAV